MAAETDPATKDTKHTKDPGDDVVLETAVNGHADTVVTFNQRHVEPAAAPFELEILAPADAVRRLEHRS